MNSAKKIVIENNLLDFVPLALGQLFRVLNGHKVCLYLDLEAEIIALCKLGLTTVHELLLGSSISTGMCIAYMTHTGVYLPNLYIYAGAKVGHTGV